MDSQTLAQFKSAAQTIDTSSQSITEDQGKLDAANAALKEQQDAVDALETQISTDISGLQTQFDTLVAAAVAMGLKVNLPE